MDWNKSLSTSWLTFRNKSLCCHLHWFHCGMWNPAAVSQLTERQENDLCLQSKEGEDWRFCKHWSVLSCRHFLFSFSLSTSVQKEEIKDTDLTWRLVGAKEKKHLHSAVSCQFKCLCCCLFKPPCFTILVVLINTVCYIREKIITLCNTSVLHCLQKNLLKLRLDLFKSFLMCAPCSQWRSNVFFREWCFLLDTKCFRVQH